MTKACRPRVARHKTGSAAATAVWAVVVSTVLCANLVAPIAAADTSPPPGSYLCNPPSRSNQCSGTPVVATVGPCDVPAADRATAVLPVTRGEDLHLQWPRNSHAGGVVRLAWARTDASDSASAFDAGVQEFRCFEWPCDSQNGCRGDVDGDCTACGGPARVPFELADGEWTLQWMWYAMLCMHRGCVCGVRQPGGGAHTCRRRDQVWRRVRAADVVLLCGCPGEWRHVCCCH